MKIDYEKVEGFRALDTKEQKGALADYAQTEFSVKLNKQKSFDNMLADLVAAVPAEEEKPELLIDEPVVGDINIIDPLDVPGSELYPATVSYTGEVVIDEPVIDAPNIPEVVAQPTPLLKASVSASDESKGDLEWLDTFSPTIFLMGRSARSNGYYTCPWWIYDWIKKNPDWYKDPDSCPHASAIDTIKSLVYYIKRDGEVTVRETRNSRFETFRF